MIENNTTNAEYTTPYGKVYLDLDADIICLSLSSGFDSGLLLYMCAKACSDNQRKITIQPITARRANATDFAWWDRVDNYANAKEVVAWVKKCFPNVDIRDNILADAPLWNYCDPDDPIIGKVHTYIAAQGILQRYVYSRADTIQPNRRYTKRIITQNGVTKNPDFELSGFNPERARNNRDEEAAMPGYVTCCDDNEDKTATRYEAFRNSDKRISFWIGDKLGILPTLLNVTRSCEGPRDLTDNWTQECHHCWWCYERVWAKETYLLPNAKPDTKYMTTSWFNSLRGPVL